MISCNCRSCTEPSLQSLEIRLDKALGRILVLEQRLGITYKEGDNRP